MDSIVFSDLTKVAFEEITPLVKRGYPVEVLDDYRNINLLQVGEIEGMRREGVDVKFDQKKGIIFSFPLK